MQLTWKTIGAAAAGLGLIVTFWQNAEAIAEKQPLATKGYVTGQMTQFASGLVDLQWDQTVDRLNRLQFEIGQQQIQALQLSDEVAADSTDTLRRNLLDNLRGEIGNKQKTIETLRCQIDAHDADARC